MEQMRADINELFQRMGKVETKTELCHASKEHLMEDIQELKDLSKEFRDILNKLLKFLYIALGVGITIQIVVMPLALYIILGKT